MEILLWIVGLFLLMAVLALFFVFVAPFLSEQWHKLKKGTRETIIFLLYVLWHYLLADALMSSTASKFNLIASAIGIFVIDFYLFMNYYNKHQ